MVNTKKYTESNYVSAKNAKEYKDETFVIDSAFEDEIGPNKDTKLLIRLKGIEKPIPLNKTNVVVLSSAFGDDTNDWMNEKVIFRIAPVMFQGQPVDGIQLEPIEK